MNGIQRNGKNLEVVIIQPLDIDLASVYHGNYFPELRRAQEPDRVIGVGSCVHSVSPMCIVSLDSLTIGIGPSISSFRIQVTEPDKLAAFLVPESKRKRLHTREEADCGYGLKERISLVAAFKIVIGNPRAEVVNVMESDITGKPLEDSGQSVK